MSMTAKQLIEAATNYKNWSLPHGHPEKGFCAWLLSDIETARRHRDDACEAMADHILSTIRPDDDEPVTRDGLEADGWLWDEDRSSWMLVKRLDLPVYQVQQVDAGFVLWTPYRILKSMGHLRRLVAALGE